MEDDGFLSVIEDRCGIATIRSLQFAEAQSLSR